MYTIAAQRIQVGRQGCNQCLALAGPHLRDIAIVQHHAADQLHIERTHAHCAHGCLARDGKGFRQDFVEPLALFDAGFEFLGFGTQLLIAQGLQPLFKFVDFVDDLRILAQKSLVATAKDTGQYFGH